MVANQCECCCCSLYRNTVSREIDPSVSRPLSPSTLKRLESNARRKAAKRALREEELNRYKRMTIEAEREGTRRREKTKADYSAVQHLKQEEKQSAKQEEK